MIPNLVSIIISSERGQRLRDAIRSARRQRYGLIEIIVVNGGRGLLQPGDTVGADHVVEKPLRSQAAAWNTGVAASRGEYVIPLDAQDLLTPLFVSRCMETILAFPQAAFIYTNYRTGGKARVVKLPPYNLYALLKENSLPYSSLIRRRNVERVGGYQEDSPCGFEDWDLWLALGQLGGYGRHIAEPLFLYRSQTARELDRRQSGLDYFVTLAAKRFPELYASEKQLELKIKWSPVACYLGSGALPAQSILDYECVEAVDPEQIGEQARAPAFFVHPTPEPLSSVAAELSALAIWSGRESVSFRDGAYAFSRRMLSEYRGSLPCASQRGGRGSVSRVLNRLIPLRFKERVNLLAARQVFDLRFYLQFQPRLLAEYPLHYLSYVTQPKRRERVALITPHLGSGGAEAVLLELARSLDRQRYEISVITTGSGQSQWVSRWQATTDHIYDLAGAVLSEMIPSALYSLIRNGQHGIVVIQNSVAGYSVIPQIRQALPNARLIDLVHSVNDTWELVSVTAAVSKPLDFRVVVSQMAFQRLRDLGVNETRIRLIRNGVDLDRFQPDQIATTGNRILFAARLDAVKRPMLVVEIACLLRQLRGKNDFVVTVAGSGPELKRMRSRVRKAGAEPVFEFLGEVPDLAPVLRDCNVLILTSRNEGLPLVVLEALASGKPVVASDVGAIREAIIHGMNGFLIQTGKLEVQHFAEMICKMMDDAGLRERMGIAARQTAEANFGLERARQEYRALFEGGAGLQPAPGVSTYLSGCGRLDQSFFSDFEAEWRE